MRSPLGTAAALLLSGGLVLSGCSLLPGGDDPKSADKTAPTERKVVSLPSTAWVAAAGDRVAKGGTLRLAAAAVPRSFNPLHADAAMSDAADILAPTAGGAVRLTGGGSWKVDPDYAESVKIADTNPLTIAVKLNRRAVWQGGTSITGKDMVAFWKVQNGTDSDFDVSSTAGYEDIRDVRVGKDPFSYSVVFKKPIGDWPLFIYPHLPSNVSSSPELFNKAFRKRAIPSNGPFIVSSIDTVRGAIVEKPNPRWWGTPPKLDGITWRVAPPATQAKAYVARELDAVKLQPETYDTAKASGTVQRAAGLEWTQITLNGARGPLRSVAVRRAVAHAVNRRVVAAQSADAVGAPTETLGSFTYLPGQRGYHDSSASIAYDPAKSARLLADDGWVKGSDGVLTRKGKKLVLTMPVPDKTPTNTARAEAIKRDLGAVGITVQLRTVPSAKFFDNFIIPLDFDLVTFAWEGSAFPIAPTKPLFYPLDSVQNFTGVEDDGLGAAWDKGIAALDERERLRIVRVIDERLLRDVPMVPLSVTPIVMGVRKGLANYGAAQLEQPDWTIVGFIKKSKKN